MKILVTGASGQLGRETVLLLQERGIDVVGIGRAEVDLSRPETVAEKICGYKADWVINCAAYTAVDRAEEEQALAFTVNRDAARAVAEGVAASNGRLLHVSTDFVFSGEKSSPYLEDDDAGPVGVYGQSKLDGELAVKQVLPGAVILRTAWVYGEYGNNFVRTMLRLACEREELRVVEDQVGSPSWTFDIAEAMYSLVKKDAAGTYHFTNSGVTSWYDLAVQTVEIARGLGVKIKSERIVPITTEEYPTPAARPPYSVLGKKKIRQVLDYDIPYWRDSLTQMLARLNGGG